MFIAEDGNGLRNSVRSGMSSILGIIRFVNSQSDSHIALLTEFEKRTRIHDYKHFIPNGIKASSLT